MANKTLSFVAASQPSIVTWRVANPLSLLTVSATHFCRTVNCSILFNLLRYVQQDTVVQTLLY